MKHLLMMALLLCGTSALAGTFTQSAPGLFLNSDDPGWYYVRTNCGYVRSVQIAQSEKPADVKYTPNWKVDLVRSLNQQKDNEYFLKALSESGLKPAGGTYGGSSYSASGFSVLQQGFAPYAQQGSTVYGLGTYQNNYTPFDPSALLHEQARAADKILNGAVAVQGMISDSTKQLVEVEKIRAAGQVMAQAIQAAQPLRTETHSWQAGQAGGQVNALTAKGTPALDQVKAEVVVQTKCVGCHGGGQKVQGDLDLTKWAGLDPATKDALRVKVISRVTTSDPSKVMPPADKGALTGDEKLGLIQAFSY